MAFLGRPNVGKSSLINSILGEQRHIVSELAGSTRDAVETHFFTPNGHFFTLIDTAGISRKSSYATSLDKADMLSLQQSLRCLRFTDVVVLVLDVTDGVTVQDFRICEKIAREGKACLIAMNKWDLLGAKTSSNLLQLERDVLAQLRPVNWAPIVFVSAKEGHRLNMMLQAIAGVGREYKRRISTATLNLILSDISHLIPFAQKERKKKIFYGTQISVKPPTFVLFVNDPDAFGDIQRICIENTIREQVGYLGTPIRIYWSRNTKRIY